MKEFKTPISIRGDSLYCPLPISIDLYWGRCFDCLHCYFRKMNAVWGEETRVASLEDVERKLVNGTRAKDPKSPLAWALRHKKTLRWGNKIDPFCPEESEYVLGFGLIEILNSLNWSYVIQTMNTSVMMDYSEDILRGGDNAIIMPQISPGLDRDWETFEHGRTTRPLHRIRHATYFKRRGLHVGVNGEPFIPGWHTVDEFDSMLQLLKSHGINRYNTYSFHLNDYVAKRIYNLPGVDIEKIWRLNQDDEWKKILAQLLESAKKHDIILGCPDFVNTGSDWKEKANTCCGIDVPNPCTFNTHYFKRAQQNGLDTEAILDSLWDGVGVHEEGRKIVEGKRSGFYTLADVNKSSGPFGQ